jgi:hypothetical protein
MKIINLPKFILGVINCILATALCLIAILKNKEGHKIIIAAGCLFAGYMTVRDSIETKAERLRKAEELKEKARLYGWDRKAEEVEEKARLYDRDKED